MGGGKKGMEEALLVPASVQERAASVDRNKTRIPDVSGRDVMTQSSQGGTHCPVNPPQQHLP